MGYFFPCTLCRILHLNMICEHIFVTQNSRQMEENRYFHIVFVIINTLICYCNVLPLHAWSISGQQMKAETSQGSAVSQAISNKCWSALKLDSFVLTILKEINRNFLNEKFVFIETSSWTWRSCWKFPSHMRAVWLNLGLIKANSVYCNFIWWSHVSRSVSAGACCSSAVRTVQVLSFWTGWKQKWRGNYETGQ